jgi:hypothetical protein
MPYKLTSLLGSRNDPRKAGRKHHAIRKGRMRIGSRFLGPAQEMIISDAAYEAQKANIDKFTKLGALKSQRLLGTVFGEDLAKALGTYEEPAPKETKAAPAKAEPEAPAEKAEPAPKKTRAKRTKKSEVE